MRGNKEAVAFMRLGGAKMIRPPESTTSVFSSAIPRTQDISSTIDGFEIDTGGTASYARGLVEQSMRLPQERW